jgi:hypothetical protein
MVELKAAGKRAALWVDGLVTVVVAHQGRGVRRKGYLPQLRAELKEWDSWMEYVTPRSHVLNTANGRPRFLATIEGLPVTRYRSLPYQHGEAAMFVTPGGTVLKVYSHIEKLPETLWQDAERLGLTTKPALVEPVSTEREDLSTFITAQMGTPVRVRQRPDGTFLIAGSLTESQQQWVSNYLYLVKQEEDAEK